MSRLKPNQNNQISIEKKERQHFNWIEIKSNWNQLKNDLKQKEIQWTTKILLQYYQDTTTSILLRYYLTTIKMLIHYYQDTAT